MSSCPCQFPISCPSAALHKEIFPSLRPAKNTELLLGRKTTDRATTPDGNGTVLRKLPDGGEVPIKINLYRAREDLSERIYIQPGDFIMLQYTPLEAIAAFFERHLLETALFGLAAQQFNRPTN